MRDLGALRQDVAEAEEHRALLGAGATDDERKAAFARLGTARRAVDAELRALADEGFAPLLRQVDPEVPLMLLPVRLETRLCLDDPASHRLLVRIFPDDIHIESHEPHPTDGEVQQARRYWRTVWRAGRADNAAGDRERLLLAAWGQLAGAVGARRARWLVRLLKPVSDTRPPLPVPDTGTVPEPSWPEVPVRGRGWNRAATASTLPDMFVVRAYQGDRLVAEEPGKPVPDVVHVGPDPDAEPAAGGPHLDPALLWLKQYDTAVENGLAITVPLRPENGYAADRKPLLTRVVVFGVSASLAPEEAAARVAGLLSGRDGDGEAAFVPQGTPTNNLPDAGSPHPAPPDVDRLLGAVPTAPADGWDNGRRTAAALGLPPGGLDALPGADDPEQADARNLQLALWSATGDFFLDELMDQDKGGGQLDVDREWLRVHHHDHVRARGPLPVLRVGRQPYGLLPVTATARWRADTAAHEPPGLAGLHRVLGVLRPFWEVGVGTLPRVDGPDQDDDTLPLAKPERDVLRALGMAPVSGTVSVRKVQGGMLACFGDLGLGILGSHFGGGEQCMASTPEDLHSRALNEALGIRYRPRITHHVNGRATRLWLPYARPHLPEGQDPVAELAGFLDRVVERFELRRLMVGKAEARTLLEALLRHSANLEYGRAAAGAKDPLVFRPRLRFAEVLLNPDTALQTISSAGLKATPFTLGKIMQSPAGAVGGADGDGTGTDRGPTVSEAIVEARLSLAGRVSDAAVNSRGVFALLGTERPWSVRLAEMDAALQYLAGRVKAWDKRGDAFGPVERLLGESLDLVSHRLDAWITSLATARLHALRKRRPAGVQLGAYGWVENLSRHPGRRSRGWVLAPSIPQAATAAILRSGALSHPTDPGAFAVDLSSRRMRVAMTVVDGMAQGQPLGALLGYRLERRLHDERETTGGLRELDRFIAPLRAKWSVQSAQHPGDGAQGFIGPHDVTDGARLAEVPEQIVIDYLKTQAGTTPMSSAEQSTVRRHLTALRDDLDAVADLLLAESVHQLANGSHDRAAATMESLAAGGQPPPRPQVLDTPRRGIPVGHRVLVVVPEGTARAAGWDGAQQTARPRALAEPRLDAWAGHQLGPTARIRLRAAWLRPGQTAGDGSATVTEHAWPLARYCALDVVALASAGRLRAVLEHALTYERPANVPEDALPQLRTARAAAWPRTTVGIAQVEALAAAVTAVLSSGRAGTEGDLAAAHNPPQSAVDQELKQRADTARDGLRAAHAAEDLEALAAYGVTGPPSGSAAELQDQLAGALRKGRERLGQADELAKRTDPGASAAVLEAVFGSGFRAVSLSRAPEGDALDASFGSGLDRGGDARLVPGDWVEQMGMVRPGAGALADLLMHTQAAGTGAGHELRIGQVPFAQGDRWVGAHRTADDEKAPATGLVVHGPAKPFATHRAAVLVVDEWSELIPAQRHTAGATFHYDAPGARAPQAVLLAVPPEVGAAWTPDVLAATVVEALDLAKLRLVDLDALGWLGRYLPAAYLPDTALPSAPSVNMKDLMKRAELGSLVKLLTDKES
ncbi:MULTISPECIES: hypothetical protein [Streptomyces]|uniref:Uncharacterized protein n=1 Tax=Streptomyces viridochromogenes TaxID=1938 RepID=A0A0L8JG24_STRVR|nr:MULTISPECIES: hypothetical protein [Streptomyces]KOG12509.1 hypothetical protein ADK34_32305 [Streptomyces viridochromogenes]